MRLGAIETTGDGLAPSRAALRAEAFRRLMAGELQRGYRLAGVMLGDSVEAEDAVHDAAVIAWTRFGSLRDPDRFEAWYGRILLNVCRDRLRRRRRRNVAELAVASREAAVTPGSLADPAALIGERAAHLAVIVLRHHLDLTVAAIADRLGVPEGTVKSRLHHAHRHLRAAIEEEDR